MSGHADQQSVTANFHLFGGDRPGRRQYAEFDLQKRGLFEGHWVEARVLECGGARRVDDSSIHRTDRKYVANASTQLSVHVERCECTARFSEMGWTRLEGDFATFQRREDRLVSQLKQQSSLFLGKLTLLHSDRTRSRQRHHGRTALAIQVFCGG